LARRRDGITPRACSRASEAAAATIAAISINIAIRDGYAPILDALGIDQTENPAAWGNDGVREAG
jgi:hypothetical protein